MHCSINVYSLLHSKEVLFTAAVTL